MALDLTQSSPGTAQEVLEAKAAAQALRLEIARIEIPMMNDEVLEAEGTIAIDEARRKRALKIAERDAIQRIEEEAREQEAKFCNQMLELQHWIKSRKAEVERYEERVATLERRIAHTEMLGRHASNQ